ncbi:MAG: hypothetical protein A2Y17_04935 [Clostridiales bacterium GWF2_38_85]|nr:MAG: hypothetical protein A2Y17_04935 [Clostridiales bacterium GWF2_38_85]HBL84367.1 hypothetical protein [Clostridiales bacterium]
MIKPINKPNQIPESYSPVKPVILNMVESALHSGKNQQLPSECIITPKEKIASFTGEKWPFSNVEPAVYSALGLLYDKTERRDVNPHGEETGALINDDIEYAIHNVLTGHAFGLFYDMGDNFLSMAMYGFSSYNLNVNDYSEDEIAIIIKDQLYSGNSIHINASGEPFDYLIWGYKDDGNILLGYKFEHGNDMLNCSYDLNNPIEFDSLVKRLNKNDIFKSVRGQTGSITLIQPDGDRLKNEVVYRQALAEGYRMLTQVEPNPEMDFVRVHFGYGQAIYDEWIRQIEEMEKENREQFFNISPIFPHFIALYENRLQLLRFLKHWNKQINNEHLQKAIEICEQLKNVSSDAATLTMDGDWNPMRDASNHEKRAFALDALRKCRAFELEIAESIKEFIDAPESYSPKKPEILNMAEGQLQTKNLTENVLSGIPFMGYGNPSAVCYIGSVMRLMDFLNDPIEADELFSLSGTAFCFPWKNGLTCDEVSIISEIPKRTFAALGYESEYIYEKDISKSPRKYSKEFYIKKIKDSIDNGHPVVGFGFTQQNFTCLITGYYNDGKGMYMRAYWSPEGTPEGYDNEKYYYTEDWYDKCYGIVVIGEKTGERLNGTQAYQYLKETAKMYNDMKTGTQYDQMIYNNSASFDEMINWLRDDFCWDEGCDMGYCDLLLSPCGLLLLNHYRSYLHSYLSKLNEQCPELINTKIKSAIERLGESIPAANYTRIDLAKCVDPSITDFSMLHDRVVRKKVAAHVERLKKMDQEIFDSILES